MKYYTVNIPETEKYFIIRGIELKMGVVLDPMTLLCIFHFDTRQNS